MLSNKFLKQKINNFLKQKINTVYLSLKVVYGFQHYFSYIMVVSFFLVEETGVTGENN